MTYKNYLCVRVCAVIADDLLISRRRAEDKRNSTTYLRYPEEAPSDRNGGDIIFLFSLLVCLKRRAENKIDNNGYQFQETYYLNRNEIIY